MSYAPYRKYDAMSEFKRTALIASDLRDTVQRFRDAITCYEETLGFDGRRDLWEQVIAVPVADLYAVVRAFDARHDGVTEDEGGGGPIVTPA